MSWFNYLLLFVSVQMVPEYVPRPVAARRRWQLYASMIGSYTKGKWVEDTFDFIWPKMAQTDLTWPDLSYSNAVYSVIPRIILRLLYLFFSPRFISFSFHFTIIVCKVVWKVWWLFGTRTGRHTKDPMWMTRVWICWARYVVAIVSVVVIVVVSMSVVERLFHVHSKL